MIYTSINNPKIKKISSLKSKKFRDKENLFLVEGEHLVKEAYNNNCLKELLIPIGSNFKLDVETHEISENIINFLTDVKTPTGIFGICKKKDMKLQEGKILVLDAVQDPGNLGTIIRSAAAFNIGSIVINDKCADIYSPKVIRSTQGLIFSVNIIKEDLKTFIKNIKKTHKVYATKVDNGKSIKSVQKEEKFVIIMGSEGQGVSPELLDLADEYLYIPMNSKCESLNVAVATSIILYELEGE